MEHLNLADLNNSQRAAVEYSDGVSLVIAGAGSGKTRVLTYKIAYLLQNGYSPYNILALTFTNKAANEMKQRVAQVVGVDAASRLWMGTFHSVFLRILRSNAHKIGFENNFTIYDKDDQKSLIRTIIKELKLDDKIYKPKSVSSIISTAKNALITPRAYAAHRDIIESDIRAKRPAVKDIYAIYATRCHTAGAMDFDDILLYTNILFRDNPDILNHYGEVFKYVLVDEFQDVNFAQNLIIKQLTTINKRLCVVGDDAQSIYSFRGANIQNILNLSQEYGGTQIFKLEQNYRSTKTIVNVANSLIEKNRHQIKKRTFSENPQGSLVKIIKAYSDFEEGYIVASNITELYLRSGDTYNNFAILYRTNAQSRVFEEALRKRNIPYRIYGGISFYHRKEIKDIIAYIRLVTNPSDEEALKRIINYPARGIGETTIKKISEAATLHRATFWDIINSPIDYALNINSGTRSKLKLFCDIINNFMEQQNSLNPAQLIEHIIKESGIYAEVYSDRLPENLSRQENIQELVNGVIEFTTQREESGESALITDFLSEISLATDQDNSDEEETERVTLMTVHAAKGLEYKNVFVVGLEEDLFPSAMAKASQQEVEEERRLLYVAITRAEANCVLTYSATRYRNGQTTSSPPSRFLYDLDLQYIDATAANLFEGGRASDTTVTQQRTPAARSYAPEPKYNTHRATVIQPRAQLTPIDKAIAQSPQTKTNSSVNLSVGTIIAHDRFGEGEILTITGDGENCKIAVNFKNVGEKSLLLKFAKFKIVE